MRIEKLEICDEDFEGISIVRIFSENNVKGFRISDRVFGFVWGW